MSSPKLTARRPTVTRPRSTASGTSIMLPVSSSAPPITTSTRPRLNLDPPSEFKGLSFPDF